MITDEEVIRISAYMKQRYGIDLSQKKVIINGRLENYLRRRGWKNFHQLMDVEKDETGNEEKMLVNFLTTNHTYFMREFEHFDFFKKEVLPWLKVKESKNKDLHIWCGAASTGEEPYMIAMVLADFFGLERDQWDTRVLATDISTKALQQAITGIYSSEINGGIQYQVKNELKREVIFRQFNLMDPFPFKKKLHTVFLRNVMIYCDDNTKRKLIQKVYDALEPGGYLFIGTTETLDRSNTPFQIIQPSIFRKGERK